MLEHQLKKLKERYDINGRDDNAIKLKNIDEDLAEHKLNVKIQTEYIEKHEHDMKRIKQEIADLENESDRQREILEEMLQKLKEEIERVSKDLRHQ